MVDRSWHEHAAPLAEWIAERVDPERAPVLVQAGHFMLHGDPRTGAVQPMVIEEIEDPDLRAAVAKAVGIFPMFSWVLGVELVALLRSRGVRAELCTLVNDWQYIRQDWPGGAHVARATYYSEHPFPLGAQARILDAAGLGRDVLARFDPDGPRQGFLSEQWLRRRLERRLKGMVARGGAIGLEVKLRPGALRPCVTYVDFEKRYCLLYDGQANCAGEVTELLAQVSSRGYSCFVNLYPHACEHMVNAGTQVGLDLFRPDAMDVVSVGLSASGEATPAELLAHRVSLLRMGRDVDSLSEDWKGATAGEPAKPGVRPAEAR